ncbi:MULTISPECIES: hypothetical protein [Fischerella]|uniref:hypothetical protein n=1 Tax=Fischerella TaxID=1190 RepID=UPI000A44E3BD|nr:MULTISPECIES: hypothetical protein [Fischerella]
MNEQDACGALSIGFCCLQAIAKDDEPPSCQERQDSILYLPNKIKSSHKYAIPKESV